MTTRLLTAAAAVALLGMAACSDRDDNVVQAPEGMTPTEQTAEAVPGDVAANVTALGMNRDELEDADLVSAEGADLGDVEAIIIDDAGAVTGFAIDLEGSDRDVVIALDQVTALDRDGDKDLQTALTAQELAALPVWDRDTMRSPAPGASGAMAPASANMTPPAQ